VGDLAHVGAPLNVVSANLFAGGSWDALAARLPGRFAGEARNGQEIIIDPTPGTDPGTLGAFVLQPLLGYVLMQRGHLVLHASCVDIGGRAVAIAGASGEGKSTTAAALLRQGHRLLCDDLVALSVEGLVFPGPRRVKLWPEAAAALGHDPNSLDRFIPDFEKRKYRPARHQETQPAPLYRVYILALGSLGIERLGAHEALPELIRHTYAISAIRQSEQQAWHFGQLTHLLGRGSVRRLSRSLDLARLDDLARIIERDLDSCDAQLGF